MSFQVTLDPRKSEDRISALIQNYTSSANSCPYYCNSSRSKCEFDKLSRRTWDCYGICFEDGFTCQYIVNYQDQYEKLNQVAIKKGIQ